MIMIWLCEYEWEWEVLLALRGYFTPDQFCDCLFLKNYNISGDK